MFSIAQNYLTRGFWGDEAWTSLISQLPYVQMLKTTAADFHPPGYYTVVELLYKFVAPTEINTRIVSIIFYLLTIFLVFKLASFVRGKNFGVLSALVVALNPIFFTYAFEARNYTMFAFAATGSVYYLVKLSVHLGGEIASHLGKKLQLMGAFVFFSALGIYTHYYMFFVLASQFFYILLFDRKILLKMIGIYAIVGVLYLPWIPFLYAQLSSVSESYWIGGINARTHFEAILRILGGENKTVFRPILFWLSTILLLIGICQHALRHKFEKQYLLIWSWTIIPFILASLPGLRIGEFAFPYRPIFFWRYLIPASIPLAMVMVHTAQKFPKILMMISVCAIIVLNVTIDANTFARYPHSFKQVYEQDVLPEIEKGDAIVTVLPSFAEVLYYRNRNNLENDLIVLSEGLVQFSGKSLLDAYTANGIVTIDGYPDRKYFEMRRGDNGPNVEVHETYENTN